MEIISVIQNEASLEIKDGSVIFWKSPITNFNVGSRLVVKESEQALFYNNGVCVERYKRGTHTLSTENAFFISSLRRAFTGGRDIFTSEVCFVDMTDHRNTGWSTETPFSAIDAWSETPVNITMSGTYTFHIDDPVTFAKKLMGGNIDLFLETDLHDEFSRQIMMYAQKTMADIVFASGRLAESVTSKALEISAAIQPYISGIMEDYGVSVRDFCISYIEIEKDENRQRLLAELTNEKIRKIQGISYIQAAGISLLDGFVKNPGNGATGSGIAGLAGQAVVGASAAGIISSIVSNVFPPLQQSFDNPIAKHEDTPKQGRFTLKSSESPDTKKCHDCNKAISVDAKFCPFCGVGLNKNECNTCKQDNPAGSSYCQGCGNKL